MPQDKALVWSTDGGKNRRLIGGADAFAEDSMEGFRAAAKALMAKVPAFDLETMQAEQERLAARQKRLGGLRRRSLHVADPGYQGARGDPGYGQQGLRRTREQHQGSQP